LVFFRQQQWAVFPATAIPAQGHIANPNGGRFMMVNPVRQQPSPQLRMAPSPVAFVSSPQVRSFVSPPQLDQNGYRTVGSPQTLQAQTQEPRYVAVQRVQAVQMQPQQHQPVQSPPADLHSQQQLAYMHTAPISWETVVHDERPMPEYAPMPDYAPMPEYAARPDYEPDHAEIGNSSKRRALGT
jgi:hypothetical protein